MNVPTLVLPEDEGLAQTSITSAATTPNHQDSGNVVAGAGNATENATSSVDKAVAMLLPTRRGAAEGYFHDTIPSFASSSTSPSVVPAATEPPAFPEPASVDDFLFELDEGIEPSLEPPLPDATSSTTLRDRLSVPFSWSTPTLSDGSSTIAPSFTSSASFTSSLRKKVASIASAGAFFAECLDSKPYRIFSVRTFCESLFNSRRAANARIVSVQRYGDLQGVPHRFLILHVTRADGREFYVRLDRRRDHKVPLWLFGVRDLGMSHAIDTAAVSGRLDHLLDFTNTKSGVEAVMVFPTPALLIVAAQILYAIAAEAPDYKLTKENCWFFASTAQEMLVRMFGAKYERGSLNHPTIGSERRERIKVLTYSHITKDINNKLETILSFADSMDDSKLRKAIKSVLDTIKHHLPAYHTSPPDAFQISTSTQALLAVLQRTLHEHLHGIYGIKGARIFSHDFTDKLVQIIPSLEQLQEDAPISSIIHLLESSYDSLKSDLNSISKARPGNDVVLWALGLLGRCAVLDQLPILWRFQADAEIADLQHEFERLMTTQLKFVCHRWIPLLCKLDEPHDDEIMKALSGAVPVLLHWIAAMGIMGEIDQACQSMKELQRWLVGVQAVNSINHVIRDLLCLVERSRSALAASSLSILGSSHPFIPSGSALDATFPKKWAVECRIVSCGMYSNQPWSPQAGIIHSPSEPRSVVFSPDGCHLVSACRDGIVRIWDAATRALLREMKGHTREANSVAYSPDGIHLASASDDRTVQFWDAVTGACLRELKGHTGVVRYVTFSPDGLRLASASDDRTVRVWDTATGEPLQELENHDISVWSVSFSPDGRYLASDDGNVRIWDASTGALLQILKERASTVYFVKFSPDGCYLASALSDNTIHVWNVATGVPLQELKE
ncbi:uncharacterized protein EI90DRAFT_3077524, partial [Cantharellus anzutake]|uniref:uncharacterized protein n=1 Tax=Cantharellus anzutake TaxID=1750568 RepID=UPI0019063DF8